MSAELRIIKIILEYLEREKQFTGNTTVKVVLGGYISDIKQIVSSETKYFSFETITPEILMINKPWSLIHVLKKLVEASEILLHNKNYDGHGWELISHCVTEAKEIIVKINNQLENNNGWTKMEHVSQLIDLEIGLYYRLYDKQTKMEWIAKKPSSGIFPNHQYITHFQILESKLPPFN